MSHRGNLINIGSKKIFLVRGIFDYFDKKNFTRLMEEYKDAKENNAELYVGLYSDDILKQVGHTRKLHGLVSDEDRVAMLEAIDFVDGAFIIDSTKTKDIEEKLKAKLFEQMVDKENETQAVEKK